MLITPPNYEPRLQCSPSRFKLARLCARADAFRYVLGIKEKQYEWFEVKDIPKPTGDFDPKDKLASKLFRASVAEWNRNRRPGLGTAVHEIVENWYGSFAGLAMKPEVWSTEPGRIALAILSCTPHPSTLGWWATEEKIPDSFVHDISGGMFSYEFNAYIDLLAASWEGAQIVQDYKTTSSFDWMQKPAELLEDPQGIAYPLYAMHRSRSLRGGVGDSIVARWIYSRTEGPPKAIPVDFRVTYDGAKKRALKLFAEGTVLVQRCADRVDPNDVQGDVSKCLDFYHRTCIYHHSVGGPCTAESTAGARLRAKLATTEGREKITMGFKDAKAKASAAPKSDEASEKAEQGAEGETESTQEGAAEGSAESTAPSGGGFKSKRGRPAKAVGAGFGHATVTFADGAVFDVPEGSPVHAKLAAIHSAMYGE